MKRNPPFALELPRAPASLAAVPSLPRAPASLAAVPSPPRAPASLAAVPSPPRAPASLAAAAILLLAACGDPAKQGSSAGAPPASSSAAPPAARGAAPPATAAKPAAPPADGVELQKLTLTSGVKSKDPVDTLDAAKQGQRVYGHLTVRNRTSGPQRVSVSFRVNDDERAMVDLTIEKSWSWRTWAYVTLRKEDKGELTVHVFDDHGAELGKESIPIK